MADKPATRMAGKQQKGGSLDQPDRLRILAVYVNSYNTHFAGAGEGFMDLK